MIASILIANRGEIACRIIRTCRKLDIRVIAVYSDADANALHVELADEAIHIGPSAAAESYLTIEKLIAAARRTQADAIHPGYGFLAENAAFARACQAAEIIFIGPHPRAIEAMADKKAAKTLMAQAGVPVIPGYHGDDQSDATFQREAQRIGYPLMVKAAAGGGGKGMRLVPRPGELLAALASARREVKQAFGSGALLLERALVNPRHIEFQIFGDNHGNLIHLGERECSIQRRHQKIIEETPSPALSDKLRRAMGAAAVSAGKAVNYANAATVEFLLAEGGQFYFLEMNTRLQVEHPVTELVTGLDLVAWQIRIAEGDALPLAQAGVQMTGCAIEARLYAENPANAFLPATGKALLWQEAVGEGVRVDSGLKTGDEISIYYDPLLAKIIVHGPNRPAALRRLKRALEITSLLGVTHNQAFLQDLIQHPAFQAGQLHTNFVAQHFAAWTEPAADLPLALIAATLAQWESVSDFKTDWGVWGVSPQVSLSHPENWDEPARQRRLESGGDYWRNNPNCPPLFRYTKDDAGEPLEVYLTPQRTANTFQVTLSIDADKHYTVDFNVYENHQLTLTVDGYRQRVTLAQAESEWWVQTRRGVTRLQSVSLLPKPAPTAGGGGSLRAPMPGSVIAVLVKVGQQVEKGDPLLKLEAMKMEHTIRTAAAGIVDAIYFNPGDQVEADALLLKIKE